MLKKLNTVRFISTFILLLLASGGIAASEIYKCHVNGKAVYTDEPCEGSQVDLKATNTVPSVDVDEYSSSTWYIDYSGYTSALKISAHYNVPVFIYFQADWCGYCRQLERELLNTSEGKRILRRVVKVRVTPENGGNEKALFQQFGGRGYPSIFIKKSSTAAPQKYYFMQNSTAGWGTKSAIYLSETINSLLVDD